MHNGNKSYLRARCVKAKGFQEHVEGGFFLNQCINMASRITEVLKALHFNQRSQ